MFCANCGTQIPDGSKFCANCGAAVTSKSQAKSLVQVPPQVDNNAYSKARSQVQEQPVKISFWQTGWFTLLMLICVPPVGILLLWKNGGKVTRIILSILSVIVIILLSLFVYTIVYTSSHYPVISSDENLAVIQKIGTPEQTAFHQQMKAFHEKYKAAQNEINKSAVRRETIQFIRGYFPNGEVRDWEGKIKRIETTEDGDSASLEINCEQCGYDIKFETDGIYSARSNTILKLGSPVYDALANMKEGDKVKFSAALLSDDEYGFKISTLSQALYMNELEFIVTFTSVTKL